MSEDACTRTRNNWRALAAGIELQPPCISRQKYENRNVTSAVTFILSPVNAQILAWGERKVQLKYLQLTLPKITRKRVPEYMFNDYSDLHAIKPPIGRCSFLSIVQAITENDMAAVDYTTGALVNDTCDQSESLIDTIVLEECRNEFKAELQKSAIILKRHFDETVNVAENCSYLHSLKYAVSKQVGLTVMKMCWTCQYPFQMLDELRKRIDPEHTELVHGCVGKFKLYMGNRIRVFNQRIAIYSQMKALCESENSNVSWILGDFKMKINPLRYRETTQQHYGKRGLSWQGFMVLLKGTDAQLRLSGQQSRNQESADFHTQYHDLISSGDAVRDYFMVLSGLEVVMKQLNDDIPHVSRLIFQSDNAKCYQTNSLLQGIIELNKQSGDREKIMKVLHTKSQDGKCSLDAHFAIAMARVMRYVNMRHNVVNPPKLVGGLNSNGGLGNKKPVLYTIDREEQRKFEEKNVSELHRLNKCVGRVNEIRFDDSRERMTKVKYSRFDPSEVGYTAGASTTSVLDDRAVVFSPDNDSSSDIDSENGEAAVYDMELVKHGLAFDDEVMRQPIRQEMLIAMRWKWLLDLSQVHA